MNLSKILMNLYDIPNWTENRYVTENSFRKAEASRDPLPLFSAVRDTLPLPIWHGQQDVLNCYWKAWEIAFSNLRAPREGSGFVSNFIDPAFNNKLFMWDSAFMVMFGRYGSRAFNFQETLNNLYAHQQNNGYICREIDEATGESHLWQDDPSSTGPNIMPWSEWEYYLNTGDLDRLARVFPVLLAYTQWFCKYRSWPDGSYFSSGWGCGMDNQPRLPSGYRPEFETGHMSWIDTTCQEVFANRILAKMAKVLGRESDVADLAAESTRLIKYINQHMWDPQSSFYVDRFRDGTLSKVKSIGSYWALLADLVPAERLDAFLDHLENPNEFNRPHRVPTLSADHPDYNPNGGYWRGAVWAPTNYMILRGLTHAGKDKLAHDIAMNHLRNVTDAFTAQGTLFENYAPESVKGKCGRDFVGWTGLTPIAILFEYVFGIRPNVPENRIVWDIRLLEEHGVTRYPFGQNTLINLHCARRDSQTEEPFIQASSTSFVETTVIWAGGRKVLKISG